jgi:hypothetical protein
MPFKSSLTRFTRDENGIILDTKTGLEWIAGPDKDTTWYQAKEFVDLIDAGKHGKGWSMPTLEQLKILYEKGNNNNNIDKIFGFSPNWLWVWAGKKKALLYALYFDFSYGYENWYRRDHAYTTRCVTVRERKRNEI